ncbi:hypothetical protein BJF78_29145 [Pseudonocardia sp. CNS-139]|nr:hypothetical protein BJF78_29145 [Pseudonocardia sp. CNS-139]
MRRTMTADSCGGVREFAQRIANTWFVEAKLWADLPAASDFPLGSPSGALLTQPRGYAAQHCDAKALSWLASESVEEPGDRSAWLTC